MNDPLPFPPSGQDESGEESVTGTLSGITFRNDENGYTVARFESDTHDSQVTVVGPMAGVEIGDSLRLRGTWADHPQYGKQLAVSSCEVRMPTGRKGLVKFLGGGRIKGVGPKTAEKIVDALGNDVLQRLERTPSILATVPGISRVKAAAIIAQLQEMRDSSGAIVFLQEHGLGAAHALRVYKQFGSDTVEIVRNNPYRLAEEVFSIGFRTADGVARSLGCELDSPFRVAAGLAHLLGRAAMEGHVGLPVEMLVEKAAPFLELDQLPVEEELRTCLEDGRLVEDGLVYRPDLHEAEVDVARHVQRLLHSGPLATNIDPDAASRWAENHSGVELSEDQRAAIHVALGHKLSVVTGGPGVGKTTLVRCLVDLFRSQGREVSLAAPTGRAARRLAEATGAEASTLHRLLGITPVSFQFRTTPQEPLEIDVLIVDEMSMVDISLMATVLGALPNESTLIMVGDVDQLPSVGPGDVLRAFIASGTVPVARLGTVFRQQQNSGIVRVAHQINEGENPEFDESANGQAFFIERGDARSAIESLTAMMTDRIPKRFGLDPLRDIQVLTPMHRGPIGTIALNGALREVLNPPSSLKTQISRFGKLFRDGDKVMQTRNNYDLDVFNGDIGRILRLDEGTHTALVNFNGREVEYGLDQIDQLEAAYAITCHKSQGSEFPAVLLPLFSGQYMMLKRNLVYTAFTRAKQVLVVLGEQRALHTAISRVDTGTRFGRLSERLSNTIGLASS